MRYLARHFGFCSVHVEHVANRPSYTEQSNTRQTGRQKATNRSAQDIRSDSRRRVEAETSATPEVARTCRQEQPIQDIGSTGRVNESSRLSVAKLKLNGLRNVYQTCQGDVKTCQRDGKAETEWSEPSMSIYLSLSIYLSIYVTSMKQSIYLFCARRTCCKQAKPHRAV